MVSYDINMPYLGGGSLSCTNGQTLCSGATSGVELGVVAKRRGMILDTYHTLVLPTADGGVTRMAQGKVNIMAVNEKVGKQRPIFQNGVWKSLALNLLDERMAAGLSGVAKPGA
jgi:hypothetical protein